MERIEKVLLSSWMDSFIEKLSRERGDLILTFLGVVLRERVSKLERKERSIYPLQNYLQPSFQ
ncbi:MAG: hypothetical protein CL912_01965 [Deltaproteobacteria bacterium]|nr:hypothetical protein [Deltaproteobacteria bacterium]